MCRTLDYAVQALVHLGLGIRPRTEVGNKPADIGTHERAYENLRPQIKHLSSLIETNGENKPIVFPGRTRPYQTHVAG